MSELECTALLEMVSLNCKSCLNSILDVNLNLKSSEANCEEINHFLAELLLTGEIWSVGHCGSGEGVSWHIYTVKLISEALNILHILSSYHLNTKFVRLNTGSHFGHSVEKIDVCRIF